jgi:hypothetical protein
MFLLNRDLAKPHPVEIHWGVRRIGASRKKRKAKR